MCQVNHLNLGQENKLKQMINQEERKLLVIKLNLK